MKKEKSKKKKKMRSHERDTNDNCEVTPISDIPIEHESKKEEKRKRRQEQECEVSPDSDTVVQHEHKKEKKRKRKHEQTSEAPDVDDKKVKKMKKKKKKAHEDYLSDENDNLHHQNTIENQNGASKAVIDDVSHAKPKKHKKSKKSQDRDRERDDSASPGAAADVGQWSTANLGDSDRQEKFYRLMGGLKHSTTQSKPFVTKFNSALDKKRESELNCRLEKQFEQARHTQFSAKGIGLGFSQPKVGHIDITASRSKKFDD